jgi:hypothetical protein
MESSSTTTIKYEVQFSGNSCDQPVSGVVTSFSKELALEKQQVLHKIHKLSTAYLAAGASVGAFELYKQSLREIVFEPYGTAYDFCMGDHYGLYITYVDPFIEQVVTTIRRTKISPRQVVPPASKRGVSVQDLGSLLSEAREVTEEIEEPDTASLFWETLAEQSPEEK